MINIEKQPSRNYRNLIAKTSPCNQYLYLPLWMHLYDTALIAIKLVENWIPESAIRATGLSRQEFLTVVIFEAFVHDIGKATSLFQSGISACIQAARGELTETGFKILEKYRSPEKVKHANAGMWILLSDSFTCRLPEDICVVTGSHHGKPPRSTYETDLLKQYPVEIYGTETDIFVKEKWQSVWTEIIRDAMSLSGIKSLDEIPRLNGNAQVLITAIVVAADWFASNTDYFPLIHTDENPSRDIYPERVDRAWEAIDMPDGWKPDCDSMSNEDFQKKFGFAPNEIQEEILEIVNKADKLGVLLLEANTGTGKTEAALAASEVIATKGGQNGVALFSPTQATSNVMLGRACRWLRGFDQPGMISVNLAHGTANLIPTFNRIPRINKNKEEYSPSDEHVGVHEWFNGPNRGLLADVVIGTVDQLLISVFKKKFFMLRHLGLVGKVSIIDEVHAYDEYMNEYLKRALEWMGSYGIPVILMSATLYPHKREELLWSYMKAYTAHHSDGSDRNSIYGEENREKRRARVKRERELKKALHARIEEVSKNPGYPLITWSDGLDIFQKVVEEDCHKRKIRIEKIFGRETAISLLERVVKSGGSAAVIVNTVDEVHRIYNLFTSHLKEKLLVDHASFIATDRTEIEEQVIIHIGKSADPNKRKGFIVIGTQVLQESLDYDVDVMITQPCPIDILIQRIGRLHRFAKLYEKNNIRRPDGLTDPVCYIMLKEDGSFDKGTQLIYDRWILNESMNVLPEYIEEPDDVSRLIEAVYEKAYRLYNDGDTSQELIELFQKRQTKKEDGKIHLIEPPISDGQNISGMLENEENVNEDLARASVRGGDMSIEVIAVMKRSDGKYYPVSRMDFEEGLSPNTCPDAAVAEKLATQRLTLPYVFCAKWNKMRTLAELESMTEPVRKWLDSPWLKGKLFLIFDENRQTKLAGYDLTYSSEIGLVKKKGE